MLSSNRVNFDKIKWSILRKNSNLNSTRLSKNSFWIQLKTLISSNSNIVLTFKKLSTRLGYFTLVNLYFFLKRYTRNLEGNYVNMQQNISDFSQNSWCAFSNTTIILNPMYKFTLYYENVLLPCNVTPFSIPSLYLHLSTSVLLLVLAFSAFLDNPFLPQTWLLKGLIFTHLQLSFCKYGAKARLFFCTERWSS